MFEFSNETKDILDLLKVTKNNHINTINKNESGPFDTFFNIFDYTFDSYWREFDDRYDIEIAIPGYNKEELSLVVEDGNLIIKGNNKKRGKFNKTFSMPERSGGDITANLENGLLTISSKKVNNTKTIKIL